MQVVRAIERILLLGVVRGCVSVVQSLFNNVCRGIHTVGFSITVTAIEHSTNDLIFLKVFLGFIKNNLKLLRHLHAGVLIESGRNIVLGGGGVESTVALGIFAQALYEITYFSRGTLENILLDRHGNIFL